MLAVPVCVLATAWLPGSAPAGEIRYRIDTPPGGAFLGDGGFAREALLSHVDGVAADANGNLYIADGAANRVRRVEPAGVIVTLAGTGTGEFSGDGGPAPAASLQTPYGVAVGPDGSVYIADHNNGRIRRVSPEGIISTFAGGGTKAIGEMPLPATESRLAKPRNVAVDSQGNVYLSDFTGHRVYRVSPGGNLFVIAGMGIPGLTGDGGTATAAMLNMPAGLAVGPEGELYICDTGNQRIRVVQDGWIRTLQLPSQDAEGNPKPPGTPIAVAVDEQGTLFFLDSAAWKLDRSGTLHPIRDGAQQLSGRDIAVGPLGEIYIGGDWLVRRFFEGSTGVVAGAPRGSFQGGAFVRYDVPRGLVLDEAGNLLVADQVGYRVVMLTPEGEVLLVAGGNAPGYSGDGGPALLASLDSPRGLARDSQGNLYIADAGNHRVRRVGLDGNIETIAGNGRDESSGDGRPAALAGLASPGGLALDREGNLYISEAGGNRVRQVTPEGVIRTIAGPGSGLGDPFWGDALLAELHSPDGLAVDSNGSVYVADTANHLVRKVTPYGEMSVIAGTGVAGFSGDGGPASQAQLQFPGGVAVDESGNIFVADSGNNRVRRVDPAGVIRTIAGVGGPGYSGDGGPAWRATLNWPLALALGADGSLYVADAGNFRVRRLTPDPFAGISWTPAVRHAASFQQSPVAPGQLVSLFGEGFGPEAAASAQLNSLGLIETTVAGVQVLFDGIPAPLFYVHDTQINAQAPYAIGGRSEVSVEIRYHGEIRSVATIPVAATAPGIFTYTEGSGQAVAINHDGTMNSPENPARRGSALTFFVTGEGQTYPGGVDGKPASPPYPVPILPVTVHIGPYAAEILYAGAAPGYSGLMQINAVVPGGFAPTGVLPLSVSIGDNASQPGVTIAVK